MTPRMLRISVVVWAVLLAAPAVKAQENIRAVGAVIAPPEVIAAYSCSTYAEAVFLPKVQARAKQLAQSASNKQASIKQLISQYDALLEVMCRETARVFGNNRGKVLDAYASQLPGNQADITLFLANARASRWASDSATFLAKTALLPQYYSLVKNAAPDLLKSAAAVVDRGTNEELKVASVGMSAQHERAQLVLLLADSGFAGLAPARFDFPSLRGDEVRLRKEATAVRYATAFPWFNDNASDLVRMHFNGFDVIRDMGLADVYIKYTKQLDDMLRQN
jgi:hypothetical protein